MGQHGIRLNAEEEAAVLFRMKMSGEKQISSHIKRVYFEGATDKDAQIGALQKQVDTLVEATAQTQKVMRQILATKVDDTDLKILAGVFMMLYQSVDPVIQVSVSKHLSPEGIEGFLEKKGRG